MASRNGFPKQKSESAVGKVMRGSCYPNLPKNYKGIIESRYLKSAQLNGSEEGGARW